MINNTRLRDTIFNAILNLRKSTLFEITGGLKFGKCDISILKCRLTLIQTKKTYRFAKY